MAILASVMAFICLCVSLIAYKRKHFELAIFAGFWVGFDFAYFVTRII